MGLIDVLRKAENVFYLGDPLLPLFEAECVSLQHQADTESDRLKSFSPGLPVVLRLTSPLSTVQLEQSAVVTISGSDMVKAVPTCDIPLEEFVANCLTVSVRLMNGIHYAANNGELPFRTVGEYLAAGLGGSKQMLRLPNLGRKSIAELDALITGYLSSHTEPDDGRAHAVPVDSNISFLEFVGKQANVSVRLCNAIQCAALNDTLPFATIGKYLAAGHSGARQLQKLPNLGRKSVEELESLIASCVFTELPGMLELGCTLPENFGISLLEYLNQQTGVSTRLHNAIHAATIDGICPFSSVADYVRAGTSGLLQLRKLKNMGSGACAEFKKLVQQSLLAGTTQTETLKRYLSDSGFPDVEKLIETIFASLKHQELDILLDRVHSRKTLEDVAGNFGVTRERVRQIEKKALLQLANGYGKILQETAQAVSSKLCDVGIKECTLHELAALMSCDVITAQIFFALLRKLVPTELVPLALFDEHVILKKDFLPESEWNSTIKKALLAAEWPVELSSLLGALASVPQFYVRDRLCKYYGARIVDGSFVSLPKFSTPYMCIQALLNAGGAIHISNLRAMIVRSFGQDISEQSIATTVGKLKEAAICAPGTYVHYENLPFSVDDLKHIRNMVFSYLHEQNNFVSSKVLFDRLFYSNADSYPAVFNHYLMLGIVQDDARFITKRGHMVGLSFFDLEDAFISLEDEVRNLVLEEGPISIPDILARVSATRKLCNDTGVRQILAKTPTIIRVGRRTFDSLHRLFKNRYEYDEFVLAIKVCLLSGTKGIYALTTELSSLGFLHATVYVVDSIVNAVDQVIKVNKAYGLAAMDLELSTYQRIVESCLSKGQGQAAVLEGLQDTPAAARAELLVRYDSRFLNHQNGDNKTSGDSELLSILDEFDF